MRKTIVLLSTFLMVLSNVALAQDDDDVDFENNANRLIHLHFTQLEIYFTIAAVVLMILGYWTRAWKISGVFFIAGCIALLPAVILILSLAMTALKYAFYLAVIIGVVYYLGKKIMERQSEKS